MNIGNILCWLDDDGNEVKPTEAKEVMIHVSFDSDSPILKEDGVVPDAFSVTYTLPTDFSDLNNEGQPMHSWELTDDEHKQIKDFVYEQLNKQ